MLKILGGEQRTCPLPPLPSSHSTEKLSKEGKGGREEGTHTRRASERARGHAMKCSTEVAHNSRRAAPALFTPTNAAADGFLFLPQESTVEIERLRSGCSISIRSLEPSVRTLLTTWDVPSCGRTDLQHISKVWTPHPVKRRNPWL